MKIETRTIGANTYQVTQFTTRVGQKVLADITAVLGRGILAKDIEGALRQFPGLLDKLTDAFIPATKVKRIATTNAGEHTLWVALEGQYDACFEDDYVSVIHWITFAVEVNFARFLAEAPSINLGSLTTALGLSSTSPKE